MSRWNSCLRKGGLALGVSALALGATAGSALATAGVNITGQGSSLQRAAQTQANGWAADWLTKTALTGTPRVTYTPNSSGQGLAAFALTDTVTSLPTVLDGFVGTDVPPTATEIANSRTASGTTPVTVPVAQAPVALLLSLPAGCTPSGTAVNLTNVNASRLFSGGFASWTAFFTAVGQTSTGCGAAIQIQVRSSASGTTLTTKHYFTRIDPTTWTSTFDNDGTNWPSAVSTGNCSPVVVNNGGGDEVRAVASFPGSVGYANLADAVAGGFTHTLTASTASTPCSPSTPSSSHSIAYALVQDNGITSTPTPVFSDPITTANRANTRQGTTGSWTGQPTSVSGASQSWAGTSADNPSVGDETVSGTTFHRYPIVAPTYDIGWDSYAGFTGTQYPNGAAASGATAADYLNYIVDNSPYAANGGQTLLNPTGTALAFYSSVPTNILTLARTEAGLVG